MHLACAHAILADIECRNFPNCACRLKAVPAVALLPASRIIMLDDMVFLAGDLASYDGAQHSAHGQLTEPSNYVEIEKDLILLGLAGLEDPPRDEVPLAVRDCQLAGIRVRRHLPLCAVKQKVHRHLKAQGEGNGGEGGGQLQPKQSPHRLCLCTQASN